MSKNIPIVHIPHVIHKRLSNKDKHFIGIIESEIVSSSNLPLAQDLAYRHMCITGVVVFYMSTNSSVKFKKSYKHFAKYYDMNTHEEAE